MTEHELIVSLIPKVGELLANATHSRVVCDAVGITTAQYREWREKGRLGVEPYATFERATEAARRNAREDARKTIRKAGMKDWKAAKAYIGLEAEEELAAIKIARAEQDLENSRKRGRVLDAVEAKRAGKGESLVGAVETVLAQLSTDDAEPGDGDA